MFKQIPGHPRYSINKSGQIINNKNIKMKPCIIHGGYLMIDSRHNGKRKGLLVHRAVALTFIPNPLNKPEVNHKDGDKSNNNDWNLEWATPKENMQHAFKNGFINKEKHAKSSSKNGKTQRALTYQDALLIRSSSQKRTELARSFNVKLSTIDRILQNKTYISE